MELVYTFVVGGLLIYCGYLLGTSKASKLSTQNTVETLRYFIDELIKEKLVTRSDMDKFIVSRINELRKIP
jgi:hypothetical protein